MKEIKVSRNNNTIAQTLSPQANIKIGKKEITAPFYGTMLKTASDLHLLCNNISKIGDCFSAIALPGNLAQNIILEKEQRLKSINLMDFSEDKELKEKEYKFLRREKIWYVDPLSESDKRSPQEWNNLASDPKDLIKEISNNLKNQADIKTDFIVPKVPILKSNDPKYILDSWLEIVKTTGTIAKSNYDLPTAIPIYLHINNFQNPRLLRVLSEKIRDELFGNQIADHKIVILKLLGLDLFEADTSGIKIFYKDFTTELSQFALDNNKAIINTNSNSLGYFSIANGFNGYIEPINGVTGEFAPGGPKMGKYYHPEDMKFTRAETIKNIFMNKKSLPCHCIECEKLNSLMPEPILAQWNKSRRLHLLLSRKQEINEVKQSITQGNLRPSIIDRIGRSGCKNLIDAIKI